MYAKGSVSNEIYKAGAGLYIKKKKSSKNAYIVFRNVIIYKDFEILKNMSLRTLFHLSSLCCSLVIMIFQGAKRQTQLN